MGKSFKKPEKENEEGFCFLSLNYGQLVVLGMIRKKNNNIAVVVFAYFWPNLSRSTFGTHRLYYPHRMVIVESATSSQTNGKILLSGWPSGSLTSCLSEGATNLALLYTLLDFLGIYT
jgi:hypothetical protein